SRMSTVGATEPPPTVQVTVEAQPPASVSLPLGAVAANGAPLTWTTIPSLLMPPPPARLSRTVQRKFRSRFTSGSSSVGVGFPARMSLRIGKVRAGLATGGRERNSGPVALVARSGGLP